MEQAGPSGPFAFYPTGRKCPTCGELLLSREPVSFGPASKILHMLGMPCYCMACNGRFRATGMPWMRFLPWLSAGVVVLAVSAAGALVALVCNGGNLRTVLLVSILLAGVLLLSRVFPLSRGLWWRLASVKKVFAYQEGF